MKPATRILVAIAAAAAAAMLTYGFLSAQDMKDCPMHKQHMKEQADQRGDAAMGFDHSKTTHHFRLTADGGTIEVQANDPKDGTSIEQIRTHLREISGSFARGDFAKPKAVHGKLPDGAADMTRLQDKIKYQYEELLQGAAVKITSDNQEALDAIHSFLRFQIEQHGTGDPVQVTKK